MIVEQGKITLGMGTEGWDPRPEEQDAIEVATDGSLTTTLEAVTTAGRQACGAANCCLDIVATEEVKETTSDDMYSDDSTRLVIITPNCSRNADGRRSHCTSIGNTALEAVSEVFTKALELHEDVEAEAATVHESAAARAQTIIQDAEQRAKEVTAAARVVAQEIRKGAYAPVVDGLGDLQASIDAKLSAV